MHRLRHSTVLARLLLALFALAMGVASAAPLVQAPAMERLCSATGEARWMVVEGQPSAQQNHGLECALCLPPMLGSSPPPVVTTSFAPPLHRVATPPRQVHVPVASGAPFPPRAPPY